MMKNPLLLIVLLTSTFSSLFLFNSCRIEKRLYRNGFHIEWRQQSKNLETAESSHTYTPEDTQADSKVRNYETDTDVKSSNNSDELWLTASVEKDEEVFQDSPSVAFFSTSANPSVNGAAQSPDVLSSDEDSNLDCDEIIKHDGDVIAAIVDEVGVSTISYRMCNNPEGAKHVISKSDVFMIKYADGTTEKISIANNSGTSTGGSGKSQLVALILVLFIGLLGIHRFYLGYPGAGIIQLLTAGACGIWTLIDLILIITGDLKPKNGEYGKRL